MHSRVPVARAVRELKSRPEAAPGGNWAEIEPARFAGLPSEGGRALAARRDPRAHHQARAPCPPRATGGGNNDGPPRRRLACVALCSAQCRAGTGRLVPCGQRLLCFRGTWLLLLLAICAPMCFLGPHIQAAVPSWIHRPKAFSNELAKEKKTVRIWWRNKKSGNVSHTLAAACDQSPAFANVQRAGQGTGTACASPIPPRWCSRTARCCLRGRAGQSKGAWRITREGLQGEGAAFEREGGGSQRRGCKAWRGSHWEGKGPHGRRCIVSQGMPCGWSPTWLA